MALKADVLAWHGIDWQPEVMAKFHVALMPFACNEATRSISPTKTLEYLAAGLRVVSTSVPDVVNDYGHLVHLADDADTFAAEFESLTARLRDTPGGDPRGRTE